MVRLFQIFVLAAVAAFAAGPARAQHSHGGHSDGGHSHGAPSFAAGEPGVAAKVTRRIEVVAHEGEGKMSFEPNRIAVQKGETVEFTLRNAGQLDHEFVLGSAAENAAHAAQMASSPQMKHDDPNAARIAAGQSATLVWRFSISGDFEFACLIPGHYEAGMKGAAVVR